MTGPRCRCCGKPIPKQTQSHYFYRTSDAPASKPEAQRRFNQQVVHVRYGRDGKVWRVTVWDGRSYIDDLFCKRLCAERFGRAMAERGYRLK